MDEATEHWVKLAERDLASARTLVGAGDTANGLMLCQQALEKGLKAVLQSGTPEPPPRIHNLPRLAEMAGLLAGMPEDLLETLVEVDPYIIEGRYPVFPALEGPDPERAADLVARTEVALRWLSARLK